MPQSIPKGLTREHILQALDDLDAGIEHPFGKPTGYELVHDEKYYAPKAVIGVAVRHLSGEILPPSDFSGGEQPGQANYELRKLGFQVVEKGQEEQEEGTGKPWSDEEVRLIVADYFDMLQLDLLGQAYKKSEHNERLREKLNGRSRPSVEFKHRNISAVLLSARHSVHRRLQAGKELSAVAHRWRDRISGFQFFAVGRPDADCRCRSGSYAEGRLDGRHYRSSARGHAHYRFIG